MIGFLDALDGALGMGADALGDGLKSHIIRFADSQRGTDGGFTGRLGGSDIYYTDFGLRVMALLHAESADIQSVCRWLDMVCLYPRHIIDCFNILNTKRIVEAYGLEYPVDEVRLIAVIEKQRLSGGGYSRLAGSNVSAYNTFLATLSYEMLGTDLPDRDITSMALRNLRRPDGGYSETPEELLCQTNATAAAAACLTMWGTISTDDAYATAGYIASMQTSEGGIRAHSSAHEADLLSTFTGMVSMSGLGDVNRINLPSVARYIQALLDQTGGFRASLSDQQPDIEYTYYGLGSLALMRVHMLAN